MDNRTTRGRRVDALEWLRAVQRRSDLSMQARAIAAVLFTRMDPGGASCFPSLDSIARDAGYRDRESILSRSASTGRKARVGPLDELAVGGWILREPPNTKGRGRTTRYSATIPIDPPPSDGSADASDCSASEVPDDASEVPDDAGHDLAIDLASEDQMQDQGHRAEVDLAARVDADRRTRWRDPPPADPDRVLGDYDSAYHGGHRLGVLGVDRLDAHELIVDFFGHDNAEDRAARAGYDDGADGIGPYRVQEAAR